MANPLWVALPLAGIAVLIARAGRKKAPAPPVRPTGVDAIPVGVTGDPIVDPGISFTKGGAAGGAGALGAIPWKTFTEATRSYQNRINAALVPLGRRPIAADGKLGPLTCGAAILVSSRGGHPELAPDVVNADCREVGPAPGPADQPGPAAAATVFTLAVATKDPGQMRAAAAELDAEGERDFAASLRAIADEIEAERRGEQRVTRLGKG